MQEASKGLKWELALRPQRRNLSSLRLNLREITQAGTATHFKILIRVLKL